MMSHNHETAIVAARRISLETFRDLGMSEEAIAFYFRRYDEPSFISKHSPETKQEYCNAKHPDH